MSATSLALIIGAAFYMRKPPLEILSPTGEPADWSSAPVVFRVQDRVHCIDRVDDHTLRLIWGSPRRAENVDTTTGARRPANLEPETFRHGCPQTSPDGRNLIYEGFDENNRPHIFHSSDPTGRGAEAVVSCAAPTHRSEPLWLSSGEEFVFDADSMHPAIFSLSDSGTRIISDHDRPKTSVNGFFKAVSRAGDRIAVSHDLGSFSSVNIYRWPGLDTIASFRCSPDVGAIWAFGQGSGSLTSWNFVDGTLLQYRIGEHELTRVGQVAGYEVVDLLEVRPGSEVIQTSRTEVVVEFRDAGGALRQVPNHEPTRRDFSPSMLPSGDVLFVRKTTSGFALRSYDPLTDQVESVTDGPFDSSPSALPHGDFLVLSSISDRSTLTVVRCPKGFRGSTANCTKIVRLPQALEVGPVSADGQWAPYLVADASGPLLKVLRLDSPDESAALAQNASTCQLIWSGPETLWASLRVGSSYRWTEIDVRTKTVTGRSAAGTGCLNGEPDPNPPLRPAAWTVIHHDSRLLLKRN